MPKSSNHLALARQWEMLKKIPTRSPGITATELSAWLRDNGYAVSKRTVERDLNDLSRLFGLSCNDGSTPYRWHWLPGKGFEFGSIEVADAASLCLARDVLEKMLPSAMLAALAPKFEQAQKKLATLQEHPLARWSTKVRYVPANLTTLPPKVGSNVMDVMYEGLLAERQIEVDYAPFNEKNRNYVLHPLSLIQKGGTPYLVATAFDFKDVRLYALHRMRSAKVTEEKGEIPDGYSVDRYISSGAMEFGSGKALKLKAEVGADLGIYLSETPIAEGQDIKYRHGRWILTAEVRDTWQLHFWLLSQGSEITVVSPKSLRLRIRAAHEAALKGYDR